MYGVIQDTKTRRVVLNQTVCFIQIDLLHVSLLLSDSKPFLIDTINVTCTCFYPVWNVLRLGDSLVSLHRSNYRRQHVHCVSIRIAHLDRHMYLSCKTWLEVTKTAFLLHVYDMLNTNPVQQLLFVA